MPENKEIKKSMSINSPNVSSIEGSVEAVSSQIMLKFIRGPRTSETIKFIPNDAPILIGRNFDCHV